MYAGSLVELSEMDSAVSTPLHPYTIGLLDAMPRLDSAGRFLKAHSGQRL